VANWAFAQAAVSLGPLLSQLTAANIQQVQRQLESEQKKAQLQAQIQEQQSKMLVQQLLQLQQQQQQQAPAPTPQTAPPQVNNSDNDMFARQLKQAYDSILLQQGAQQQQQGKQPAVDNALATAPSDLVATSNHHARPGLQAAQLQVNRQASTGAAAPSAASDSSRTAQDKAGGSDLMRFLNSLRQSYEDALREKPSAPDNRKGIQNINWLAEVAAAKAGPSEGKSDSSSDDANPRHPIVTDSASSQQLESSAEDSEEWTSKKTDLSSSSEGGDSDKEVVDRKRIAKERSQGPPRKRHKIQSQAENQVRN